jgi:PKD repeat protein
MKQTQIIFLTFIAGQSSTSKSISVPFKVKTIHTKSISLSTGDATLVNGEYVTITSDLVNSSPLGSTFNISSYAAGTIQDIENQFWNPQLIQGLYNFTMRKSNGDLYTASTGNDTVSLIIEFNSPEEIDQA